MSKVIVVDSESLIFDDGLVLSAQHYSDCCENHWLSFSDLKLEDFEGLEFDLLKSETIEKIEDYGIALHPIQGHPIRIPGYGSNNGYYSKILTLIISDKDGKEVYTSDITNCQVIEG